MGKPLITGIKFDGTVAVGDLVKRKDAKTLERVAGIYEGLIIPFFDITSFTINGGTSLITEKGVTVNALTFAWTYNWDGQPYAADPTIQAVSPIAGAGWTNPITPALRTVGTGAAGLTTDQIYTLNATGADTTSDSLARGVYFRNKRYWAPWPSALMPPSAADILTNFSSEFGTNRFVTKTFTPASPPVGTVPTRLCIAYPASWLAPASTEMGGLPMSQYSVSAPFSFTNASGHTENYILVYTDIEYNAGSYTWQIL